MAREVSVSIWCDLHLAEDEHVEGTEIPPLAMGAGKPRVLALCDVHRKEIYDPLVTALAELGQPVGDGRQAPAKVGKYRGGSRPQGGEHACPVEGCPYPGAPTRGALGKHARNHHDSSLAELEHSAAAESDPLLRCPECDKGLATAKGLGAHRSRVHGVAGMSASAQRQREKRAGG